VSTETVGYRIKTRVVTFYVHRGGINAEYDVSRTWIAKHSADDLVKELGGYYIREKDARSAHAEVVGQAS
jgi:hypothetical protein